MWTGAKDALENGIANVAFLRTNIELITEFFAENEISEIWITFPDPQMKKVRKRLTSTRFMDLYRQILKPDGIIHLKSDSNFMYTYTCEMIKANHYPVNIQTDDLYNSSITDEILEIKTFYEQQWLERGLSIKYIQFICEPRTRSHRTPSRNRYSIVTGVLIAVNEVQIQAEYKYKLLWHYILNLLQTH